MFGLRLESGEKVTGLFYKPNVGDTILIDKQDKWYKITKVIGRIAYSRRTIDPRG
jgi:hypothetical protein